MKYCEMLHSMNESSVFLENGGKCYDYIGCMGICCKIGDNAFYFLGSEDDNITKEDYWKSYTLDMTIDIIFNILKSAESAEENGLDDFEIGYYESVLKLMKG